jgi:hypothetical protein
LNGHVYVVWAVEPVNGKNRLFVRPLKEGEH